MEIKNITIKEIPFEERPRERLLRNGAEGLSNAELLAILIRSGIKNENALALSYRILNQNEGIRFLAGCSVQELKTINGIGTAKAAQLKAAIELGKRLSSICEKKEQFVKSPEDGVKLLMEEMRYLKKEYLKAILLDVKCRVVSIEDISIGNLNSSIVHPREVFVPAIRKSCASIIIAHNHPSGDPTPSVDDINITKRIYESGKILGVNMMDHLIIGDGRYISLKEEGYI